MRKLTTFASLVVLAVLAGCAAEAPAPKAPIAHDQSDYAPAEYVEMSFNGAPEAPPKPAAAPTPHATDKPNVAATRKGALFGLANKTKD